MFNSSVISHFLSYFCRTRADRFIMKIIIAFSISLLSFSSFSNMRSSCLNKLFFKQNENDVYDKRVSKWHKKKYWKLLFFAFETKGSLSDLQFNVWIVHGFLPCSKFTFLHLERIAKILKLTSSLITDFLVVTSKCLLQQLNGFISVGPRRFVVWHAKTSIKLTSTKSARICEKGREREAKEKDAPDDSENSSLRNYICSVSAILAKW